MPSACWELQFLSSRLEAAVRSSVVARHACTWRERGGARLLSPAEQSSLRVGVPASGRGPPDMPEEAGLPPAKRFRPGSCPPGRRVAMLLTAGGGGGGGAGGGRRQTPPLPQPSASPYREALELQRRSLPIFRARGQLLAQLRNLDSAVLIGE